MDDGEAERTALMAGAIHLLTARPHRLLGECVERIGALASREERCMMIVPSQYTLQAELEIMARLDLQGSFYIDVLSPGRLQGRVFERAGQPDRIIFDERGKCMVLSAIIEEEADALSVYKGAAKSGTSGFTQKASALIADFKRSGQSAQDVALAAQKLPQGSGVRNKLMDIAHLYGCYERRMEGRLADAEDVSREMLSRLERSDVLKDQHVFIFGFDMITPGFAKEIAQMAQCARSVTLAVETDENAAADGRLFAPVNFSLMRLRETAQAAGAAVEQEKVTAKRDIPEDLCALEKGLYALGMPPYDKKPESISLMACSTPRAETHLCAAKIRRMLLDGERAEDIAIVFPKGSGYAPLLASILPMYGIKAYVAEKRAAQAHPLCRFVLSALSLCSQWRTQDVVECMQSGFLPVTQEEADALCSYAESADLRADGWRKPLDYVKSGDEEELAALEDIRLRVTKPLTGFIRSMKAAQNADETVRALVSLLDSVGAFDRLDQMRAELEAAGLSSEAEDCAQVLNKLMQTLDQLHTLLSGERGGAQLTRRLLGEGLEAMELSALPPADGAVICGEIGNVRTAQVASLFALGMNDTGAGAQGSLLSQQEAQEAADASGAYLGMSDAERAALAQLDELKALSGATRRVAVSYALADETGRALREGTAVQAMKRLFPLLEIQGGLPRQEQEQMFASPEAALEALSVQLSDAVDGREELSPAAAQAYALLSAKGDEALRDVTRKLSSKPHRRLDARTARELYGRPVMSVSRLETFAQCPYMHFIRYGLSPKRQQEPGVDRAELGTLYHRAAELFARAVTREASFPEVDEETCARLMDEASSPLIEAWRRSPLGKSSRGEAIARRIRRTVQRAGKSIVSQYAGSSFTPMENELVFGQRGMAPITLELADGSRVFLQGRIDRVDVMEDGHIRVIDYKSGAKKFDPTMAYYGIQLQLLIYLAAAMAMIPGSKAAGFFYCRIADPTVKTPSRIREEVERQIAKKLALAGVSLSDVTVLRAQGAQYAQMITRDGKVNARHAGSMADEAGMQAMADYAMRKAADIAGEVYAGEIGELPAQMGAYHACAYCDYAAICGFDASRQSAKRLSKKTIEDLR